MSHDHGALGEGDAKSNNDPTSSHSPFYCELELPRLTRLGVFFAGLIVGFCLILRVAFFVMGAGIAAISMPKTSASSVSLSALPVLGA